MTRLHFVKKARKDKAYEKRRARYRRRKPSPEALRAREVVATALAEAGVNSVTEVRREGSKEVVVVALS